MWQEKTPAIVKFYMWQDQTPASACLLIPLMIALVGVCSNHLRDTQCGTSKLLPRQFRCIDQNYPKISRMVDPLKSQDKILFLIYTQLHMIVNE